MMAKSILIPSFILICVGLLSNAQTQIVPANTTEIIPSTRTSYNVEHEPTSSEYYLPSTTASTATSDVQVTSDTRIPLYLSAYFTLGGAWDGSGILPAVEMALDHINENADVLPGYELKMVWNDTRVSKA